MAEESKKKEYNLLQNIIEEINSSPYYRHLGMIIKEVGEGKSKVEMEFIPPLLNFQRVVHGGAIASLADSAGAIAAASLLTIGESLVTIEFKINFLIPFKSGKLTAYGRAIYKGSRIMVSEVDLKNDENKLIAKAVTTQLIT